MSTHWRFVFLSQKDKRRFFKRDPDSARENLEDALELLSAGNKKIKRIQALVRSAKDRREEGVYIAEGVRMYKEAPKKYLKEVYLTPEMLKEVGEPKVPYYAVSDEVFSKISDTKTPQGVLCVLERRKMGLTEVIEVPSDKSTEESLDKNSGKNTDKNAGKAPLILLLENIQDPGNLGTILRVGEAAGVTGIVMSRGCVDIYNPKVIRSTMGSVYRMKFTVCDDILEAVKRIKEKGIITYAAHLHGSLGFTEYDYTKPTCFFIGNEGNGLSEEITAMADKRLLIPMEGSVESLNAGIAAAVLSYEAHRQRF
ncbi:MAG: RNA methyltransferase [Lachnospiraceae bacterium]|nr:RNA methyltransferase [Lachnospiraceae bacterium]